MSSIVSRLLGCGDLPDRSSASSFACTRHAMRVCRALVHMLDIPLRCVSTGIATALLPVVAMTADCLLYIILPLLQSVIPLRWVGSRSYCVQERTLTLSRP